MADEPVVGCQPGICKLPTDLPDYWPGVLVAEVGGLWLPIQAHTNRLGNPCTELAGTGYTVGYGYARSDPATGVPATLWNNDLLRDCKLGVI